MLNPRRGVPQWGYNADTQTCTCQRICGSHGHYPPVQSLLRCFRGSFLHCRSTVLHYIARLRFTFRWEGMTASTNCSSNVNCCATLRTYLVHREQRSTMTEERNSKTACSSKVNHAASSRCACSGKRYHPHTRVRHGSLASDAVMLRQTIHPHTRMRDGSLA